MPPAQEILGELLRDEAQLQEQADGALTQQLGEASCVVDGEEEELSLGVEATLEDERVETGVKTERVAKGLIGEDGSVSPKFLPGFINNSLICMELEKFPGTKRRHVISHNHLGKA